MTPVPLFHLNCCLNPIVLYPNCCHNPNYPSLNSSLCASQLHGPLNWCLDLFNLHHPNCYAYAVLLMCPYCCRNVILLFPSCYLITILPSIPTATSVSSHLIIHSRLLPMMPLINFCLYVISLLLGHIVSYPNFCLFYSLTSPF